MHESPPVGLLPRPAGQAQKPATRAACDLPAIAAQCARIARADPESLDLAAELTWVEHAAAAAAGVGIPLETVLQTVHEAVRDALAASVYGTTRVPPQPAQVLDRTSTTVRALDLLTSAMSAAYVDQLRALTHSAPEEQLVSALLAGTATSTQARQCGIEPADEYDVLALAMPPHPDTRRPGLDSRSVARSAVRRVHAALTARYAGRVLAVLSVDGGTVLVTADGPPAGTVIAELSRAAGVALTAASVVAAVTEIPEAAERAHGTLDVVQRLGLPSGVHRFTDLVLEYQLTRPGPGREHLGRLLAPLDDHPELLDTLRCHLANDLSRTVTARRLHVHANTVDYRLRRIAQLTGLDLGRADGLWYLRSAFVAHSYAKGGPSAA
ncbi:PucR family transcriptional regulator [Nocardia cyriacigeorgica]|uniref:PucR family transcriptional regulator n=1 Tax=Nocardia cyriacigeorgica TaxID=135487 RepID=UPI002457C110|nr:helix-turn-helix domain-containing protein [Nocardia cyriacigeorgica]